jgi:DNA replication and repair protein RecF
LKILRFTFQNYRNLEEDSIFPCEGTNLIYGKNAQGKTNLLEAMWLFTGGHSFRGAKDGELVRFGEASCTLGLEFFSEEREQTAKMTIRGGKREAEINGILKRSAAALVGKFCAVIFSPEHLALVKGGPALRRSFLDGALCQSRPAYAKQFVLYQRTLQQRNTLLKDIPRHRELLGTLEIWDEKLAKYGAELIRQREEYLSFISEPVKEVYRGISQGKEELEIFYQCSLRRKREGPMQDGDFYEALEASRNTDIALGYTASGPHRDDMELKVDGISARSFGSQGQQRSIVLAMKLAEAQVLQQITGEAPVIFLDDVMSELDAGRQDYLLNHVKGRQVFLTCCDPNSIRDFQQGALFHVESGKVSASQHVAEGMPQNQML